MGTVSFDQAAPEQRERLMSFKRRLRGAASAAGMATMADVAEASGIKMSTLSRYMTGERLPSLPTLMLLADCLGVTCDYLAGYRLEETAERTRGILEAVRSARGGERTEPVAAALAWMDRDGSAAARLALAEAREALAPKVGERGKKAAG